MTTYVAVDVLDSEARSQAFPGAYTANTRTGTGCDVLTASARASNVVPFVANPRSLIDVLVTPIPSGSADFSGDGTLAVTGEVSGSVALSGSGTLAVTGEVSGSVAFSGSGTLGITGEVEGSVAFSGDGTLDVTSGDVSGSVAFSGGGTLSVQGIAHVPAQRGPNQLGCPQEYQIIVTEEIFNMNVLTGQAQFGRTVGDLNGIVEFTYDRRLDDTSEAVIRISTNADCCTSGFLNDLHVWHHGIAIYRDGELVWDGPLVLIDATRTEVTLTAHDVSALLSKRWLPRDLCFSLDPTVCTGGVGGVVYGPQAPETVASILISKALLVDGHGAFVEVQSTGTAIYEASYRKYGGPVFDLVQRLATEFINWTVLGRRIIVSVGGLRTGDGIARTAILMCDDFVNDNFRTVEDGLATLTQDVQIADPIVVGGVEETNIGVAQIFNATAGELADPYYGLLQGVQDGNKHLTVGTGTPSANLAAAALNIVNGAYPPPVVLSADDMQLAPTAPIRIAELVPGTIVPVHADCLCRPVSQEFVLSKVSVTVDSTGEKVIPTFVSLGSDNATEEI